ncbi:MAG: alpha/beta hydrolase [Georgfuchsia sp.]
MLLKFIISLLLFVIVVATGLVGFVYLSPGAFIKAALYAGRHYAGLERKEITLADGLRYVYLEGGQGEPLLLLHGFGADKNNFIPIAPYLRQHYHLIIPDHIGFGESSKPPQADYSPDAQAERLHAFVQALGLRGPLHVGGNSMGGMIALHYGKRYPADTASLWLLDPAGMFSAPQTELFKHALQSSHNPLQIRNTDDMAYLLSRVVAKPPFIPWPILDVLARKQIANRAVQDRALAALINSDTEKRIAGLNIPSLIVWGDQDQLVHPAGAEILHKLLPNSTVVIMPGIGHVPMMEAPARTAADYLRFRDSRVTKAAGTGKPQEGQ